MELPERGLGTMGIDDPDPIETAIELGYRHLDTAQIYDNEAVVGEGIARAAVDRDDLVVATKLWIDQLDRVAESTAESLERLGLECVDLLYVHRPKGAYDPDQTLPALADLQDAGVIDAIAVSNFELADLERFIDVLGEPPAANQVEYHPLFQPTDRLAHARKHDYPLVAYSPLSGGRVGTIEPVVDVAKRHAITPEQASLAWLTAKGIHPIPKASSHGHLAANLEAIEVTLEAADLEAIDGLERERELFPE
ncbi:aldo/keto reductase [Natronorubrum bangense]|uniref:Aldo/keto reductase n=2 Tax=Natronorubrum bangense TaxID=61858 RepID=L9WHH1_9EURY|nr:aldo/keto reductase [Natronorubrum bangense]ELY47793.1 aldo/keto reductase [Natronorubrum bangense JCM 10635]QCC53726.1 aldo/keto reductase [Natronorubrum bangense]